MSWRTLALASWRKYNRRCGSLQRLSTESLQRAEKLPWKIARPLLTLRQSR